MSSIKNIIDTIISYLNENKAEGTPKIRFDLLSVKDDSLCITTANQQFIETPSDVAMGNWVQGQITLKFIYRRLIAVKDTDDLNSNQTLDEIVQILLNNRKKIYADASDWFIFRVSDYNPSKLERVYSNSCKDYTASVVLTYQREI